MAAAAANVVAQEQFLIETVCTNGNFEVEKCSVDVTLWWAQIADVIYNTPEYVNGICHIMSGHVCPGWGDDDKRVNGWDCETCQTRLPQVAEAANDEENLPQIVQLLQGLNILA